MCFRKAGRQADIDSTVTALHWARDETRNVTNIRLSIAAIGTLRQALAGQMIARLTGRELQLTQYKKIFGAYV